MQTITDEGCPPVWHLAPLVWPISTCGLVPHALRAWIPSWIRTRHDIAVAKVGLYLQEVARLLRWRTPFQVPLLYDQSPGPRPSLM